MAGAAVSHISPTFAIVPKFSLKPLLFSPLSTPIPSKSPRRRNYLRPKILKTIPKPSPSPIPINPITPEESQLETKFIDVGVFKPPDDEMPTQVWAENDKVEDFRVSEASSVVEEKSGSFGKISASSVLKFGFCFVGIFMFQTLIAVWVMGNGNSQDKDGDSDVYQSSNDGRFTNNVKAGVASRNMIYWDDSELEEKVEEIRAMAREARNIEKKELKNNDDEEDDNIDESLNSKTRIGIEKEIGARLNKLEKKLNSERENFPGSSMNFLDKLKDAEDAKEINKKLFVKKKFKFRAPEENSKSSIKGFSGLKDGSTLSNKNGKAKGASGVKEVDDGKRVVSQSSESLPSNGELIEEEEFRAVHNTSAGSENSQERLSTKVMKSRKSRDLDTKNLKKVMKENQQSGSNSDEKAFLHNSKSRDVRNHLPSNKVKNNQSGIKNDPWWLKLPYVLAILMRRGVDHEGPQGLFALSISSECEQSETSCTVAFEDHSDANNFCYLLECFFEDLGDFSAEVVPMSVKELFEAIKSNAKKVIVVKKGQLKLYAGQPFAEVELALQSLIEDNQTAYAANLE